MKSIANALCFASILVGSQLYAISEPYDSIKEVAYEPYFLENSWILLDKINSMDATVFIDVESPEGEAARFVGSYAPESVRVYSINSWSKNDYQFQTFLSNVIQEATTERIVPIRMTSDEASAALNLVSEVIYIACDEIDSVSEKIFNWVTHLSEGGVLAGNKWEWPQIELAVINAADELNLSLSIDGNYWFLSKQ